MIKLLVDIKARSYYLEDWIRTIRNYNPRFTKVFSLVLLSRVPAISSTAHNKYSDCFDSVMTASAKKTLILDLYLGNVFEEFANSELD